MKKTNVLILFLMLVIAVTLVACGGQTAEESPGAGSETNQSGNSSDAGNEASKDEKVIIRMADHLPAGHHIMEVTTQFMDNVEEKTGGKVTFEYFPGEQLGKLNEMAGLVKDGAADMGYTFPTSSGFLPLSTVGTLPTDSSTSVVSSTAYWQVIQGAVAKEWEENNLKPIYVFVTPPNDILMAKELVKNVDDIAKKKMRTSGGILDHIPDLLGAVPVSTNVTEIYESMQRGVVDGAFMNIASAIPYQLGEVTQYVTRGGNFGSPVHVYAMNLKVWNSLSSDVQGIIMAEGEKAGQEIARVLDKKTDETIAEYKESGVEFYEMSPEEWKGFYNKIEPLEELWIEDMETKGSSNEDASNALKEFKTAINEEINK